MYGQFFLLIGCGAASAFLFHTLRIPGGYMLGAIMGSMAAKLIGGVGVEVPRPVFVCAEVAMGICVGAMFSPEILAEVKSQIPIMALSTLILLAAGILSAIIVYHVTGLDVISSILATSPGGLNAVIGMADVGPGKAMVSAFQMLRLYMVLALVPACCWIVKLFIQK